MFINIIKGKDMKIIKIALFVGLMTLPPLFAMAEGPGGPGSGPNGNGTPVGNGGSPVGSNAPVGSGIVFLVLYAGAYGLKKTYTIWKKKD